eukprot:scaffold4.g4798.t1
MGAPEGLLGAADPTVCDAATRAAIEASAGLSLSETPKELLAFIVDRSRQAGNEAFKRKSYKEAVHLYSQAIAARCLSERAPAALRPPAQAAWDARKAIALRPDWAKGHYRLGCALLALNQAGEAAAALAVGVDLEPGNADMATKLADARGRAEAETAARSAQASRGRCGLEQQLVAATERRDVVLKLRAARREDQKLAMLNQFKQSMVGPDWELEDLEWRPTFLPGMKLAPQRRDAFLADPRHRLLVDYLNALADLAHPKQRLISRHLVQVLAILADVPRLEAYDQCIAAVLQALQQQQAEQEQEQQQGETPTPPAPHALVLAAGGGALGLLAARAGAGAVTCVERSRMLFRMAKQALEANRSQPGAGSVRLMDRRLQAVGVAGEAPPPDVLEQRRAQAQAQGQSAAQAQEANGVQAPAPGAAEQGTTGEDAGALLPQRADLLVTDLLDHSVLGMGLLPAIDYAAQRLLAPGARVVPQAVQVYAALVEVGISQVSGFDLSALNAYCWYPHHERVDLSRLRHRVLSPPFAVHRLDLQARAAAAAAAAVRRRGGEEQGEQEGEEGPGDNGASGAWEHDAVLEIPITAAGCWNAVAFWFEASLDSSTVLTSYAGGRALPGWSCGGAGAQPIAADSWGQALQFLDGVEVAPRGTVQLRVRQDAGQYVFTSVPPQCRPRHALVPRWHFDMVLDDQRNQAYESAIRRAIQDRREAGAGADSVYAAEMSQHMCDVGEEATIMNGFLGKITMLDRDARRLDVLRKPDGTPPDLPRKADVLIYEVFDSGCIGEGVLHLLAAAQAKLLARGAALVPASATVWCQPLQLRTGAVEDWVPLADPVRAFTFDFADWQENMRPAEAVLDVTFTQAGVVNAVAMWFDLHLDEETSLSTSPYRGDKGPTWQQAVQWVDELAVEPGARLQIVAKHDTYSISYSLRDASGGEAALEGLRTGLVKACVQNPLEYRAVARAAVRLAARPHDLGIDAQQVVEFCTRMMG